MSDKNSEMFNLFALGDKNYKQGNYPEALEYFKKYIQKQPEDALAYNMIGHLYKKINENENIDEQIEYFKKAIELKPDFRSAVRNLAFAYYRAEKYIEAIKTFHKLFELKPFADDYCFYGCIKLKLKDFKEGWKFYEYRFAKKYGRTDYPEEIDKPLWRGEDIKDKTLLVHFEQGIGDSIQFVRYLKKVKPLTKKIIFRVQNELVKLFKLNFKDIEIIGKSTPIKDLNFDYHIPLLSLMYILEEDVETIPSSQGYIKADEKKVKQYKKEFFNNDCLKIGISYSGMQLGNRKRNIPLRYFYKLAKLDNVKLYSFQKGFGANQLEKIPQNIEIINVGQIFKDFSDTAAALENVDLFVTSDNSVFNLAGAMGRKTFLLLNKDSEWRWFLDEEKTPWYNSVKIFKKQTEKEDWSVLISKITEEVKKVERNFN